MHVKLTVVQFETLHNEGVAARSFTRVVIGSANLTADDWCNLRQGFFVAESNWGGSKIQPADSAACDGDSAVASSAFGNQVEDVLRWLSLPLEIVSSLRLSCTAGETWSNVPDKTRLIFSVPSTLQNAIRDQQNTFMKKLKRNSRQNQDYVPKRKDDDEDEDCSENMIPTEDSLPPLEAPSSTNSSGLHSGRKFSKHAVTAHEKRKEFYSEFLPVVFDLNDKYVPPLQVLRNCIESISTPAPSLALSALDLRKKKIVYQASSVGGVSDVLLRHFIAATDATLPYPPPNSALSVNGRFAGDEKEKVEGREEEELTAAALLRIREKLERGTIITPFPSVSSVVNNAARGGWCGAITLRYFQLAGTKLHSTGWRRMSCVSGADTDEGPTCHTKLIYDASSLSPSWSSSSSSSLSTSAWLVLGSHNFTADCWAFAKQMLPRNFELSVFIPLSKDDCTVQDLFPVQTSFDDDDDDLDARRRIGEPKEFSVPQCRHHYHHHHQPGSANSPSNSRFVFLNHKRDFFGALQSAEREMKKRTEHVVEELLPANRENEQLWRKILTESLEYHYSKFKTEVHDDFGRH